jgi:hypothetical protein
VASFAGANTGPIGGSVWLFAVKVGFETEMMCVCVLGGGEGAWWRCWSLSSLFCSLHVVGAEKGNHGGQSFLGHSRLDYLP